MTSAGRDDPDAPAVVFTRAERQAALERLARISARQEFTHLRADAVATFWGEWLRGRSRAEAVRATSLDESKVAFHEWFVFDYRLPGGSTLAGLLLDREGDELRVGEQRYLERMRLSHLRPYEVVGIAGEDGLDFRDLWSERTIRASGRPTARPVGSPVTPPDLLIARVILGARGAPAIEGFAYALPEAEIAPLRQRLRREHRDFAREWPDADLVTFFKHVASIPFHIWLDRRTTGPSRRKPRRGDGGRGA